MPIDVKICGLRTPEAIDAAVTGGARFVGFVFYPKSPRAVTAAEAALLAARVPDTVKRVGLFVDEPEERIAATLAACPLDMLQLHGQETPATLRTLKSRFGLPVMKALGIATARDLDQVGPYEGATDWLLFDAKPPATPNALPGGNACAFDWSLLRGRHFARPWMLSGGLTAETMAAAVRASGARVLDVSSGVETRPGEKSPEKIRAFLASARRIEA